MTLARLGIKLSRLLDLDQEPTSWPFACEPVWLATPARRCPVLTWPTLLALSTSLFLAISGSTVLNMVYDGH